MKPSVNVVEGRGIKVTVIDHATPAVEKLMDEIKAGKKDGRVGLVGEYGGITDIPTETMPNGKEGGRAKPANRDCDWPVSDAKCGYGKTATDMTDSLRRAACEALSQLKKVESNTPDLRIVDVVTACIMLQNALSQWESDEDTGGK